MKRKKYQNKKTITKAGILWSLLLLSGLLHAQVEDAPADTALLEVDTVTTTVVPEEEAPAEENTAEGDTVNESVNYFSPKQGPDSLRLRRLDDSVLGRMQNSRDFWYVHTVFKKEKRKTTGKGRQRSSSGPGFFDGILWLVIIGGFIAFLVIYLSNSNVKLFRKSSLIEEEESDVETDDIFAISYQKEIDKAISAGNYRLAVRLLFLRLLRQLSEKNMIRYTPGSTNFDYLLQVQHTSWYRHFFRVTRNYEYAWYGRFDVDREKFDAIRNDFENLERQF
jgi:hypothetical protein